MWFCAPLRRCPWVPTTVLDKEASTSTNWLLELKGTSA